LPSVGGKAAKADQLALLWVLNLSDGSNSVLDIAERSGLSFDQIRSAIEALTGCAMW
jgi:aminopeptidase-like protein